MAELIHPALRVRIARQRYAVAGRSDLRNFDWDRGIWLPPQPRAPWRRLPGRPFMTRAAMAFGATLAVGLSLTNLPEISHAASGLAQTLTARLASAGDTCGTGGFRMTG